MAFRLIVAIAGMLAVASAQTAAPYVPSPCKAGGSYHLSCYAKTVSVSNAVAAKNQCFKAWNQPQCKATVQVSGQNQLGCDTLVTYSFASDACRASYQAQEKTNAACAVYKKNGLGLPANRDSSTASLTDYTCPFPGPCNGDGYYHVSCYTKAITPVIARSAKQECFKAWKNASCSAAVASVFTNRFGCQTGIIYSFNSAACRDSYQGQEKKNAGCAIYTKSGLGVATNRLNTTLASQYQCPYPGPCNGAGSYHASCYAAAVTIDAAVAAKQQCFAAWNKPQCSATIQVKATGTAGCDTFVAYSFKDDACRDSYQGQEKTNAACALYASSGLGAATNRQNTTLAKQYSCAAPAALPKRLF